MMIAFIDSVAIWFPGSLALFALICASGFFSGSETAIFYLSRGELRQFSKGKPSEQIVAALAADADRLLTAVLFWNLLINLSYFAVAGVIAKKLADAGMTAGAGFFTVGSLLAIILFGMFAIFMFFRRRADDVAEGNAAVSDGDGLSDAEKEKLAKLMNGDGQ